jgi:uncharacterized protein (DUF433 family)
MSAFQLSAFRFPASPVDPTGQINHLLDMSAPATVEIGSLITRTPGIKGGTPHIAGTGVAVRTMVRWYKLGMSPEQIAEQYPHLQLFQVYAALAYYHANRDRMEAEMAEEEAESDRLEREHLAQRQTGA